MSNASSITIIPKRSQASRKAGDGGLFGDCTDRGTHVGLPIEAQLSWLPTTFLGVGLYGFADFNRARSFAGVTLGVQLGRVR